MSQIKELQLAKKHGIELDIKCLKERSGHEGEALYSCKVYYKKKHIANYEDLDWGNSDFHEITPVNQTLFDEVIDKIKILPKYFEPAIRKETTASFGGIVHDLCIFKKYEKKSKLIRPVSCYDLKSNKIITFKRSGGHTNESIQAHIETLQNVIPFYNMAQDKVTEYYLREINII